MAFKPVISLPLACMASANFSQTRGTAKNTVGLASMSVSLSVPLSASGRAKYTAAGFSKSTMHINGEWMSTICAAMCESGKYDTTRNGPEVIVGLCKMFDVAVQVQLSWEIITPFGLPVVPEV